MSKQSHNICETSIHLVLTTRIPTSWPIVHIEKWNALEHLIFRDRMYGDPNLQECQSYAEINGRI
jgi:hypothetical protein